ncbi:uncharacterized protein BYT42DRAFT_586902 [Radiomyces spectabilis]|uniref:uncharacterized protein n=1 Tax=Radiomyces spectabilis TaxID=64574 RepID=UPI002220A97E|nr:uncharacterized protein BYT42DRAFT_586902 [Radiomyces spectabilis]KAI8367623.1 hypothetical protein BYT42DRAFT_586902 [Radiomyces spectabilis]
MTIYNVIKNIATVLLLRFMSVFCIILSASVIKTDQSIRHHVLSLIGVSDPCRNVSRVTTVFSVFLLSLRLGLSIFHIYHV